MKRFVFGIIAILLLFGFSGCNDKKNSENILEQQNFKYSNIYNLFELFINNPEPVSKREEKRTDGFKLALVNNSGTCGIFGSSREYSAKDYSIIDRFEELSNNTLGRLAKKYNVTIHETTAPSSTTQTHTEGHTFNHQQFGHGKKWIEINGIKIEISYTVGNIVDDNYGYHREDAALINISLYPN